ncbi:MAG: hypothetical protein ACYSTL_08090, partial [Planctomycetota bacterium]
MWRLVLVVFLTVFLADFFAAFFGALVRFFAAAFLATFFVDLVRFFAAAFFAAFFAALAGLERTAPFAAEAFAFFDFTFFATLKILPNHRGSAMKTLSPQQLKPVCRTAKYRSA